MVVAGSRSSVRSTISSLPSSSTMSSRVSARPRARTSSVAGCLRLRSMRTDRMSRLSVSNSSHAPRLGMTLAL